MYYITEADYNKKHKDSAGVWTTERYDLPNWEQDRENYIGKRTMMMNENGATVLLIEGLQFTVIKSQHEHIFKSSDFITK